MHNSKRPALILVVLMMFAPFANAGVSNWGASNNLNSNGSSITITGFELPGNSTVMDGWLHITDETMATSSDTGILWDGSDFSAGTLYGTFLNENEHLTIEDDGTRSNISSFDVGDISVIMNSKYKYSPGWRHVYTLSPQTGVSECNGQNAQVLSHGFDDDFDVALDDDEILDTLYYCDTFSKNDTIQELEINAGGEGYYSGNLSATGGEGSGFSGTYEISSGVDSVSINNGGSGYSTSDSLTIGCQCEGYDANASISSVDSNGAIDGITIDDSGSGYTTSDTILFSISGSGSGANLFAVLESTGVIHSLEITDEGSNYTSSPTIIISDSSGSGASITANLGAYFEYELDIDPINSGNENCFQGGFIVKSGLDYNGNRNLGTDEIQNTEYLCNTYKTWEATTFTPLNGTNYGNQKNMSYGVIPSSASSGVVAIGTMPGSPLPAGTDSSFLLPEVNVPYYDDIENYYLSFDHWYHVDSTSSGDGDGAWVEYRVKDSTSWSDWNYLSPESGYPSTMSTDGPNPNGAPAGAIPVFASETYSGWVSDTFDLESLVNETSDKLQFRFHIWTHPDAENERPGWFIDNIRFNNDGVNYGAWHHGCYTQTANTCYYSANAYGALERIIDLTGSNSTSKIEIDMEWDLEGAANDNACVEVSLNQITWYDISSTNPATTSDCSDRSGAIPGTGYTANNGVEYGDQSGRLRTISLDIPNSFLNQDTVYLRIVVNTNYYTDYGGTLDSREGLTVDELRVVDNSGSNLFLDDFETSSTMSHSAIGSVPDDWAHYTLLRGNQEIMMNFEDSTASAPSVSDAPGWTRSTAGSSSCSANTCKWTLNKIGSNSGPSAATSFPYCYGIAFTGIYDGGITEAKLTSPVYDIPANGNAFLMFDHWAAMEPNWDGGAVFIKVNGGSWQHFDPGNWYDSQVSYNYHNLYGYDTFASQSSQSGGMKNMQASLLNYQGDTVQFKFSMGSDSYVAYGGWFIDNAGVKIANYGEPGAWLSPAFSISEFDQFNLGMVDIDAIIPDNTSVTGEIIDFSTGLVIPGFDNISFPFALSGIDSTTHSQVKLKVNLFTSDKEATPSIKKISVGGKRFLNADSGGNGWEFSSGVKVIDGLLNATTISGTLISDFMPSSRPIKAINVGGNISSSVTITVLNKFGSILGSTSRGGGVTFSTPQSGFGLSVSLPTNAWIDRMTISSIFAAPASNPVIDVLNDGSPEWSFLQGNSYGHYGWQSTFVDSSSDVPIRSKIIDLDGSNSETLIFRIPADAYVNVGTISVSSDYDGFNGPVTIAIAGAAQSMPSNTDIFYNTFSSSQISGIVLTNPTHTDVDTGRIWKDISVELNTNFAQTISVSGLGVGYTIFENVSGLEGMISSYHQSMMTENPDYQEVDIPVSLTADSGSISIDGNILYDFIITNREFNVPNTLYPDGKSVEIITSHHHLYDNSNLLDITLEGLASDGNAVKFKLENSVDQSWGIGGQSITFSQYSGSENVILDTYASYIEHTSGVDGYEDIVVHWIFDVTWNWDDVDSILWTARANDEDGNTIWPAQASSGKSGAQAVENDIQIDNFNIFDHNGRLISNIYDNLLYPFPILEEGLLNISGNVRFQDSSSHRPESSDFSVGLNISGNIILLETGDEGEFFGQVSTPSDISMLSISPVILAVGPSSSNGAEDVTGQPTPIDVLVDTHPPIAGPIQVNTPIGLQFADGMVSDPTTPFRAYVTVSENEARGDSITLKYWRTGIDDYDGNGLASEDEYQSQTQSLSPGLTGQQQVQFIGIDVSSLDNEPIHLYLEGTDWAGLNYQEGGTGGGPGATNSWASVVIAVDEPTQFAGDSIGLGQGQNSAFDLDRKTQDNVDYYLLPEILHTFSVQIDDANGLITLDNITIMLCGYGTNLGLFTYEPWSGTLWSPEDSMTTPVGFQTEKITNSVTKLKLGFKLSWDFPWDDDTSDCKPRITIDDNLMTVAESPVLSALSWKLDNRVIAIPSDIIDLTVPLSSSSTDILYLKQGDEFSVSGHLYYAGSGHKLSSVDEATEVKVSIIYGTEERSSLSSISSNGSFEASVMLPSRAPLNPTMPIFTEVINIQGLGTSVTNSDTYLTVDSGSPSALFNQDIYPDSSFTIIGTDVMDEALVTISILDEIGMEEGPLQISWEFRRGGQKITGTGDSGILSYISSNDGVTIYQSRVDFTPLIDITFQVGDQIALWINSDDKAGNDIIGLGSEESPRVATLRVMEFMGQYTREITTPTKFPQIGDILNIVTYWENPGKIDGEFSLGLWEQTSDGQWRPSVTTATNGDIELELTSSSSSILAEFKYETWQTGQPLLVIVVDGDFDNLNGLNQEIKGINVAASNQVQDGGSTMWLIGSGMVILSIIGIIAFVMRGRGEDYYDDDDDDDYE